MWSRPPGWISRAVPAAGENSPAAYRTHCGRRVAAAGFVDDTEHQGAGDLQPMLADLYLGSWALGLASLRVSSQPSPLTGTWDIT